MGLDDDDEDDDEHEQRRVTVIAKTGSHTRCDAAKLASSGLKPQAQRFLDVLRANPCQTPPP